MYSLVPGQAPRPITPTPETPAGLRYADGVLTPDERSIICVREAHVPGGVVNDLALIDTDVREEPRTLAAGHDFYAFPRLDPSGQRLAFTTWDHPRMPWEGTELWVAQFMQSSLGTPHKVAGGASESIFQPEWGPDGKLYFISDRTGWWNLYRLLGDRAECVFPMNAELGVAQWGLGFSRYTFLRDGSIACLVSRDGMDELWLSDPGQGRLERLPIGLTSCYPPHVHADESRLWLIGGSPDLPQSVVTFDPIRRSLDVVHQSVRSDLDAADVSRPEPMAFPSAAGRTTYGLYYRPRSSHFRAAPQERPPLLVASHGGPTSACHSFLSMWIQYWTTRGIAVLDVNYGGSSGYGRAYRQLLDGAWGIVDTEDCVHAAVHLANLGEVDGDRLMIRGGSAGGFTTLSALAFYRVFAAATSYYGVADLELLTQETHKFEAHYLDTLVGPYPQSSDVYRARSPIHHLQDFVTPILLFQGDKDQVVPPSQAEAMARALDNRRVPHALVRFPTEGHGFRDAGNIRRSYEWELYFYSVILGFELSDIIEPLHIRHLKTPTR
jgi:dipeptidyl aminopeptidase/acylaminoacyl peptidase